MEDQLLQMLLGLVGPWGVLVASGLGMLVVVGGAVVALTPSTSDDAAWAKLHSVPVLGGLLKALAAFSPVQKK